MRSWCMRHPVYFMGLYLVFYLSFFFLLENSHIPPDLWLHCRLDDLIPFCKYAIVPYALWFPWIPFTLFYLLWRAPRRDFWRLCLPLFTGMTLALLFCLVVPNGVMLRPRVVPGNDIFAIAVRQLYHSDTSTNVCPSIHVFNSVTLMLAYYRCRCFDAPRRRWMRPVASALCLAIIASTMLLKQHSAIDVVFGILLALALDALATVVEQETAPLRSQQSLNRRQRLPEWW
ncbi:phosphatase PAP2 family protein [uncultured Subdoligranulum sp.]|uniref:phosphatase PAP2 family protein n=1 Tax=uncultured Subdoligranulum sp. TaxID=512298 RepID=UPI002619C92D|nr:phosphatase PAP2 family protein [uncultured Subdoligranulum sp.]